jgi:Na+/H+-dicarboxylate symporter
MTTYLIQLIVTVVPLLIFAALSPAVATLVKRGLAGRFATSVVLWYVTSSTVAGLYALVVSSLIFDIPFASETAGAWSEALGMLRSFGEQSSASRPLLAIVGAILLGAVSVGIPPLYAFLVKIEEGIARVGHRLGYIMLPLILCLGVTIGVRFVRFGARVGMGHYVTMTAYTALLCFGWWLFYVFVVIRYLAKRRPAKLLTTYYVPTALFAAGTCSSLATLPVNLSNVKAYGVRDEVADFLLPFGAVANMDGSALAYIAYAPFVLSHIFGIEISWTLLLLANRHGAVELHAVRLHARSRRSASRRLRCHVDRPRWRPPGHVPERH